MLRFVAAPIVLALDALSFLASAFLIASSPGREPSPTTSPTGLGERRSRRRSCRWLLDVELAFGDVP